MRGEGIHHGLDVGRWGYLSDEDGNKIPRAAANLEVVKGTGPVPDVEAKGRGNASDLESPPPSEVRGTEEQAEKYLEEIFRRFSGDVYRIKNLNEIALGHKIDFKQGPNDYLYTIPPSKIEEIKDILNESISFAGTDPGVKLSPMTGLDNDYLQDAKIGFSRKFLVNGKEYNVRFLYLPDKEELH